MSTLFNQLICFHSFTDLLIKCFSDTLIIHTRKNMHLFQLKQFATNFLRKKYNSNVTFDPNQTDRTGVLAIER